MTASSRPPLYAVNADEPEDLFTVDDPGPDESSLPRSLNYSIPFDKLFDPEHGLVVERVAAPIKQAHRIEVGSDGGLYRYASGVYLPDADRIVAIEIRQLLRGRFKARHVREVLAWLHAHPIVITDAITDDRINVANGVLDWRTLELKEHSPEFISVNQIPVPWVPGATCHRIENFLHEVLPTDAIDFMFEVIGLALYVGNPMRVAVLLIGPGRNGKSVLLRVLVALLGSANVSNVPLQAFGEHRFATAELFRKLANIYGDLDARAIRQTDAFKTLTGEDLVFAERKMRDPFAFRSYALPIFSANEAPMSADQSQAWFDRWVIVPMHRRIADDQVDPKLAEKLTTSTELEGLLGQAVQGLRRLLERGRFEIPASVQESRDAYREKLDSVAAFLVDECVTEPNTWAARGALFQAYTMWCRRMTRIPVTSGAFYDAIRDRFAGRVEERKRHGVRGFVGIGLSAQERPS